MFRGKLRMATVIIMVFLTVLFVSVTVYAGEKITIAEFNWSGAVVVTHVMKNVMEDRLGIPVDHYQVQKGELVPIFTDPPLTPYPGSTFQVPRWIKK